MNKNIKPAAIDISVLIVFFTRQDTLQMVFDRVREARPTRLFLYQDGPRKGRQDDVDNILRCREIVSQVDWECEVHTLYQKNNYGPDESGYIADTWAFSLTDKCIVLEDDVVPAISFFSFCKEMLDRYENDERIMLISAQNLEDVTQEVESDYFFSYTTFTWGWASWARVVNHWDPGYSYLQDPEKKERVASHILRNGLAKAWIDIFPQRAKEDKNHFETILMSHQFLHGGLTIVPRLNAAVNVGLGVGSAHYDGALELMARGDRKLFMLTSHEIETNHLKHPQNVEDYAPYRVRAYRMRAWGHPWIRTFRALESTLYLLIHGHFEKAVEGMLRRIRRVLFRRFS